MGDAFRLVRLFRLLQLEHFITAFTILDNVFCRSKNVLLATGVLAMCIWLAAGALFYVFEKDNPNFEGSFDTMPKALYLTAIFLAGEWAVTDFTTGGKFLCLFLCVVGIGLAALPV